MRIFIRPHFITKLFCIKQILCTIFLGGVMILFNATPLYAQQQTITGKVVSAKDLSPLVGVTIRVQGTQNGTATTTDGSFTIKAAPNSTLIVSFVGYLNRTVSVNNQSHIEIKLEENAQQLSDVVVIGYGSVKKGDVTGSVGQVNMEELVKAPVPTFADALAGRVAGVQVTSNDGQPGAGMNIVIRGTGSLTQSVDPLYVIDGFPIEDFNPATLSPDDIESITVLKDASSTAIYGARGANGVIVIETKKGKVGKPVINYSSSFGFNKVTKQMKMMDPYEFIKFELDRFPDYAIPIYFPNDTAAGAIPDPEIYKNVQGINWQDELLRNGSTQIHNISLSGGANGTKYLVSGSIFNQAGTIINTRYKRYQGRAVLDQTINKKLTAGTNLNYSYDESSGIIPSVSQAGSATSSLFFSAWGYRPIEGPLESKDDLLNNLLDPTLNPGNDFMVNPAQAAKNEGRNINKNIFTANVYLKYKIAKNILFTIRGGLDKRLNESTYFYNSQSRLGITRPGIFAAGVQAGVTYSQYNLLSNDNVITYTKDFNQNHHLEVMGGFSMEKINVKNFGLKVQNIPNEELGLSGLDEGIPLSNIGLISSSSLVSSFGRANYSFKSKYLFTATFRADGSSKFAPQNRWGYFPSGAFAWKMGDEKFMNHLSFINDAKLRISYGVTGNNRVGDFDYLASIGLPISYYYSFNNQTPARGAGPISLGNSELKWESTAQLDIGYDLSLLKNRIGLTVDLYRKTTKNLLLKANIPNVTGFSTAYKNIGSIQNDGLEITLSTVNINSNNFSWESNFNISFNKNKVLSLNQDEPFILNSVSWDGNYSAPLYKTAVGGPATEFWGVEWDGVYQYEDFNKNPDGTYTLKSSLPTNGNARQNIYPGDIKYKDLDGDGTVNASDRTIIGRALPIHTGGMGNDFGYKRFKLNVFFQWSYGNDIFNANRMYFEGGYNVRPLQNQFATYADRWTPTNPSNTMFRASAGSSPSSGAGPNGVYSSMDIEDGSYLRLKTVSLEYSIPEQYLKKLKISNLTLACSAQNLYTWTKYSGMDPEVSSRNSVFTPGFDFSPYPRAKTIVFSIKGVF